LTALLRLAAPFGGLLIFLAVQATAGLKAAIAASLVFVLLDTLRRLRFRLGFPRLWVLSGALTVVFGAIDLAAATPFMLSYEAVITNVVTAFAFALGAAGRRPMLQDFAEQRSGPLPDRPDLTRFFRLLTLVWAAYFLAKAGLYLWAACTLPLAEAAALRAATGPASLLVLLVVSTTQGPRLFRLCRRLGLLRTTASA
jgi:uncharacterized membrane protein